LPELCELNGGVNYGNDRRLGIHKDKTKDYAMVEGSPSIPRTSTQSTLHHGFVGVLPMQRPGVETGVYEDKRRASGRGETSNTLGSALRELETKGITYAQ
jgi:hypothetical protein